MCGSFLVSLKSEVPQMCVDVLSFSRRQTGGVVELRRGFVDDERKAHTRADEVLEVFRDACQLYFFFHFVIISEGKAGYIG